VLSHKWVVSVGLVWLAIFAGVLLYSGVEIALVPTPSMEGTILVGDHLLVDKFLYGPSVWNGRLRLPALRTPKRDDVISFRAPGTDQIYVKRVVGVEGDTIEADGGRLFINRKFVGTTRTAHTFLHGRSTIPARMYFVMGDNREASEDSRVFGLVPAAAVIGEPVMVCWSIAIPQRDWFENGGRVRAAAYLSWVAHLAALTRWSRFAKLL
jgi:signal peptidase I